MVTAFFPFTVGGIICVTHLATFSKYLLHAFALIQRTYGIGLTDTGRRERKEKKNSKTQMTVIIVSLIFLSALNQLC